MNGRHDGEEMRRRRLLWRATHRGIKEMDILLGRFATARLADMTPQALEELEAIVSLADQDLFEWIMKKSPVPEKLRNATLDDLIAYRP
jgi:antitoxin CptB